MTPEAIALISAWLLPEDTTGARGEAVQAAMAVALEADDDGMTLLMGLVEAVQWLTKRLANLQGIEQGEVLAELALVAASLPPAPPGAER